MDRRVMSRVVRVLIAMSLSSFTVAAAFAGPGPQVDRFLTRMSGFGYSGNVLLVAKGSVELRKGYGLANRERSAVYDAGTIFDIGSMAKSFTAVAVLRLEMQGTLDVADTLGRWLPEAPDDKQGITIHQLLTHTSGIAVDFPYANPMVEYEDVDREEALRRILAVPLDFAPGSQGAYSNCGYILLAAVVERASGRPFREFMRDEVLQPAGLADTGFWGDGRLDATRVASGYNEYGELQHDPMARSQTTWQDLGGGQMLSTLDDLAAWIEGLAECRILPHAVVERMWTSWTPGLSSRDGDYGYGWFIGKSTRGTRVIQHGGDYLGTGAEMEFFPADSVVIVTSTNVRHDLYPTRNRTDRALQKFVFGGEVQEPPAWVEDDGLLLASTGDYRLPSGGTLSIHARGGRTYIGARGQDAVDLLLPASAEVLRRRSARSEGLARAFEGFIGGDPGPFAVLAGNGSDLSFAQAVLGELADLGLGPLTGCEVMGTFPSGYPRGNPLDFDTTLLLLDFIKGPATYAIRWSNEAIAATEFPRFTSAAEAVVQPVAGGGLSAWNIVFQQETRLTPRLEGGRVVSLLVQAGNDESITCLRL